MIKRFLPILTVFLPVAILHLIGAFEGLECARRDTQFRLGEREVESSIVVVEIDPTSLRTLGVWPWPRGYHATVIENLVAAGARRIGLDIDFSSRSVDDEDAELARVLAASEGKVILPVFRDWQRNRSDEHHLTVSGPLPLFRRHAELASINVRPESDGLVRRYENKSIFPTGVFPGLASALAGEPRPDLQTFYIDFGISTRSIPRVSYVDVLTGQFDPEQVKGKAVIIGSTAVELGDQIAAPVSAALPGPLLQALAYESLMQDRALEGVSPLGTILLALIITVLFGYWFEQTSWRGGLLLLLSLGSIGLVLGWTIEQLFPVAIDIVPTLFTIGGIYGFYLFKRIDEQASGLLRQRTAIRQSEVLMQHVVQSSFDAIVTLNDEGRVKTFNRAAELMFGYSGIEAEGHPIGDLIRAEELDERKSLLAEATGAPIETTGLRRDGTKFPVELVVTTIDTEDDPKLVAVLRDITERRAHEEELQHRATHDRLTDLPNRLLLVECIEKQLQWSSEVGGRLAVVLMDLDRFKEINDALGHPTGDALLKQVALRLSGALPSNATLARFGGDEFALMVPDATIPDAREIAQRLIESLSAPFNIDGFCLEVYGSVGITVYPDHGGDAESLIQRADVAMYEAKAKRCGYTIYDEEQGRKRVRDLTIRGDLREAIEKDLLTLAYQPQVRASTDRIIGAEALLRWKHPEHGFIPPDEFIGLAEYTGLIHPLTQLVLEKALAQTAAWRRDGIEMKVSVNLSARNLLEDTLPHSLESLLRIHDLPPENLTLEITESVIMEDPELALTNITRLRALGVELSVDDFGTGYSSLAYLVRLPVQELKIDRSFVMQMDRDAGCRTIVRSIVELSHNLDLTVVAEGVESAEIWSQLKQLGCDTGQGYYFARPVTADELTTLMRGVLRPTPALLIEPSESDYVPELASR